MIQEGTGDKMIAKIFPVKTFENVNEPCCIAPRFAVVAEDFPDHEIGDVIEGRGDFTYTTDAAGNRWEVLGMGMTSREAMDDFFAK